MEMNFKCIGTPLVILLLLTNGSETCSCGWKNTPRIIGGVIPSVNEYPMVAGLVELDDPSQYFCSATIISENYALTAGHCFTDRQENETALIIGEHDRSIDNETSHTKLVGIDSITIHPNYKIYANFVNNDIALIHLNSSIQFHKEVGPACLPFANEDYPFTGHSIASFGWGLDAPEGETTKLLHKFEGTILSDAECEDKDDYKSIQNERNTTFCSFKAGDVPCKGDSGGAVLWEDPQTLTLKLLGINSYVIGECDVRFPVYHTRVTSFLPWIVANVDDELCHVS